MAISGILKHLNFDYSVDIFFLNKNEINITIDVIETNSNQNVHIDTFFFTSNPSEVHQQVSTRITADLIIKKFLFRNHENFPPFLKIIIISSCHRIYIMIL